MDATTSTHVPAVAAPRAASGGIGRLALVILWPVVVLGAGGAVLQARLREHVDSEVQQALAARPPIAVLAPADYIGMQQGDVGVTRGLERAFADAERLAGAGYVVLDKQAVLAAPPAALATPRE